MRKIGLLGGMSFESTAVYYRLINEAVREALGGMHSAELILYSVDFQSVVDLQKANQWQAAGDLLGGIAGKLEAAGADCVLICTNTMHLVANAVQGAISIPLIDIIDATALRLRRAGKRKPLLLATRYTMEEGFYAERMLAQGIEVMVPEAADRARLHSIIFDELCSGKILSASREELLATIEKASALGADSVVFGCTEVGLILDASALPLPGFDSTAIHCEAAVHFALQATPD